MTPLDRAAAYDDDDDDDRPTDRPATQLQQIFLLLTLLIALHLGLDLRREARLLVDHRQHRPIQLNPRVLDRLEGRPAVEALGELPRLLALHRQHQGAGPVRLLRLHRLEIDLGALMGQLHLHLAAADAQPDEDLRPVVQYHDVLVHQVVLAEPRSLEQRKRRTCSMKLQSVSTVNEPGPVLLAELGAMYRLKISGSSPSRIAGEGNIPAAISRPISTYSGSHWAPVQRKTRQRFCSSSSSSSSSSAAAAPPSADDDALRIFSGVLRM
ncbi:hypothetical protein TYRP_013853 [Tyrophagus putrescentiae]|nr:hypothetical protein TYRP_013853 [Tyrophagus putrescentiae]